MLERFRCSAAASDLLARGIVGIEALIAGGDDYEILCAVPEDASRRSRRPRERAGVAVSSIGTVVRGIRGPEIPRRGRAGRSRWRLSYSHF